MQLNKIQEFIFPNAKFGASENMFIYPKDAWYDEGLFHIKCGGRISFDTYYNGLSTVLWKEHCKLDNLFLSISGKGIVRVKLKVVIDDFVRYELIDEKLNLSDTPTFLPPLSLQDINQRGIIYPVVIALSEQVEVSKIEWFTDEQPKRDVKLGISITHFNRKRYVLPSIKRIKENLLDKPEFKDKISFTVVDNSRNITTEESLGINVINNRNTGGSGGFMRGLIHYMDQTNATHVLFMDDDASCEIESIKRTYAVLSHAYKDNSAVSGALFYEHKPNILIEKGARFERFCIPFFHGWDMGNTDNLIKTETLVQNPNYGGWWFFAFPIKHIKRLSFPFFVRGDDVFFGMQNKFNIITANGIACYGEDFAQKVSPMTCYFDTRNNIVNSVMSKSSATPTIKMYIRMYMGKLFAHQYGSVDCIRLALKHIYGQTSFWNNNYDMENIRPLIGKISSSESMNDMDISSLDLEFVGNHESKFRRALRIATLNGFFLPSKKGIVYQEKGNVASLRCIYRYKKVAYYNRGTGKGYVATASKIKFAIRLMLLAKDCIQLGIFFRKKRKEYGKSMESLTSKEFWLNVLK
ncbi:galactofuranosylgalactofuranosylrhamnosyl-N-acetylglucosaminyl-diphospho-decaprenol beta-1,5/1,6-galactofuranosyltransferase [Pantoea dispersa]|uniref:glycosyltransferase family 2 protein n=1 Tax=Pantoea dispersa TaxID=59814 RepID=UPI003D219634